MTENHQGRREKKNKEQNWKVTSFDTKKKNDEKNSLLLKRQ